MSIDSTALPAASSRRSRRLLGVALVTAAALAVGGLSASPGSPSSGAQVGSALPPRLPASRGKVFVVDGIRGRDGWPGTTRRPWKTLAHAIAVVPRSGSIVDVRAGTYVGTFDYRRDGDPANPITIQAHPGEHVLLTVAAGSLAPAFSIAEAGGLRLKGFDVTSPGAGFGIRIENSHDVEIVGCSVHDTGHGGLGLFDVGTQGVTVSRNIQLWGSTFHDNGGAWIKSDPYWIRGDHSVYWGGVSDAFDGVDRTVFGGVIANNVFRDQPYGRALQIGSQVSGLIVTNNTFYRAVQSHPWAGNAIQLYGEGLPLDPREVRIVNNIIANNSHHGVTGSGGGSVMRTNVVWNNLAWGNPGGDLVPFDDSPQRELFRLGTNITGVAPRFVLPRSFDFRLQPRSPAIDAADAAYAPPRDRAGRARVSRPDIGAFEWIPRR